MYYENHPSLDALELHLLGRLSQNETVIIDDHLLECGQCRAMARELKAQVALIREEVAPGFSA